MIVNVRKGWVALLATFLIALCAGPSLAADAARQDPAAVAALMQRLGLEESATPVRDSPDWRRPQQVLVWNVAPQAVPALQAAAPGVKLLLAKDAKEAVALAKDADAVLGFCSADVLAAGPEIRWVQSFSAGVERCVTIPALRERNILLTNMQRVAGPVMAEHVMAMMLAYARGLHFYIPERMATRWTRELPAPGRMMTLEGKTVLVVGLGGIGVEVAKRAHALGMRVIATRASGREGPPFVSYVGLPDELVKLAAEADFVVNTVPLTPATTRRARPERSPGRTDRRAPQRPPRRGRARRHRSRAAAGRQPVVADAERDPHAARLRAIRRGRHRADGGRGREPAALRGGREDALGRGRRQGLLRTAVNRIEAAAFTVLKSA